MREPRDEFTKSWITEHAQEILAQYSGGITLRQLHYRLVAIGMTNDINHYKRVINAMTDARWEGVVDMESFIDRERSMFGRTDADEKDVDDEIERGREQVKAWMESYHLERWSNQDNYVEVWIEKKALQGVFEGPCSRRSVGLAPCKGYPSITFIHEAKKRFEDAIDDGKEIHILYYGDYDPSGEDIPRSLEANLNRMGIDLQVHHIALNPQQIREMGLPGVPPKQSDSRTRNWDGAGAVELDAVEPKTLEQMCLDSIDEYFDEDKYQELREREQEERAKYQKELKDFVNGLGE